MPTKGTLLEVTVKYVDIRKSKISEFEIPNVTSQKATEIVEETKEKLEIVKIAYNWYLRFELLWLFDHYHFVKSYFNHNIL